MKIFDFHCDTMWEIIDKKQNLLDNDLHISLNKTQDFSAFAQVFAIWCGGTELTDERAIKRLHNTLSYALKEFDNFSDKITLVKSMKDYEQAVENGKSMAFLALEGAELVSNLEELHFAARCGVKIITLTWNFENKYAYPSAKPVGGLKDEGKKLVKEMDKLGIICDVSHLSEQGFWDLCEISTKPIIASHSSSKKICPHHRNLTDKQFSAIIEKCGLVGINIYPPFLSDKKTAEICDILLHIENFLSLGGGKTIALGCDFDGVDKLPIGIENISHLDKLYNEMVKKFGKKVTDDIFWNNAEEFIIKMI